MKKLSPAWYSFLMVVGIAIFANFISAYFHTYVDLTQDKRYTLTEATVETFEKVEEIVYIKILLDGEFPAGFKRLQASIREVLGQIKSVNPKVQFEFENPVQGTQDDIVKTRDALAKEGIVPTSQVLRWYTVGTKGHLSLRPHQHWFAQSGGQFAGRTTTRQ